MSGAQLSPEAVAALVARIERAVERVGHPISLMEVCGSHTMAIFRSGLRSVLPADVRLISGPGCPVCVSPTGYMDHAIALSRLSEVTITTFGDMIRVPGSDSSLENERTRGADVRVVYSITDALAHARTHPERQVVFLAVGFETTIPGLAAAALAARRQGLSNFSLLAAPKVIPPAMAAVAASGARLDGFLCPGHVSVVIGARAYESIALRTGLPCVVAGFEAPDILQSIAMIAEQLAQGRAEVEIQYNRAVTWEGNARAREVMDEAFAPADVEWRGLGVIPHSGLTLREAFADLDAAKRFEVNLPPPCDHAGCRCGSVLAGLIQPTECPLFGRACTPQQPVGPCMVSSEGACAAHYKYGRVLGRTR